MKGDEETEEQVTGKIMTLEQQARGDGAKPKPRGAETAKKGRKREVGGCVIPRFTGLSSISGIMMPIVRHDPGADKEELGMSEF